MYDFVESKTFTGFILLIILMNTGILMAQTYAVVTVRVAWYFSFIDSMFLSVYLIECALKVYVYRRLYFKEGWNLLDFTIVVFNIIDFLVPMVVQNIEGFNIMTVFRILRMFRAFRAIRALRVLRTIRFMSNLQVIMTTCLQSIQSMGAIVMLILLVLYMFAVIGRGLYFKQDPVRFGMLPSAAFTLFQLLTLDDWFEIYTDITNNDPNSWHIFIFLFIYIVMEYFVFLNLFVAVLVDNFQLTLEASNEEKRRFLKAQDQEEDEDDEEDLYHMNNNDDAASDITRSSEQSARLARKSVSELYISQDSSEKDHLRHYFQCLAALEYVSQQLDSQKKTIDNIVDLCIETSDDVVT
ncbi:cation channel sperm-associated protein 1-like [Lineus longissimus]|uniref:cation channel sperm-associated protein 1-like n=1 Tax=Lineus longissimus TaxID=88925 RepID=UPI002B4CB653